MTMKYELDLNKRIQVLNENSTSLSVINDIVKSGSQEEAFHVCDIGDIVKKHQIWKEKLPRVQPFYAVKCHDNLTVLKVLAAIGVNFDCASKNEIDKVLNLGVDTSRIIFAHPVKPSSHICHAAKVGVKLMTVDNECELHKIKELYPTAKIVLRVRCDSLVAKIQLGKKFGCDPVSEAPTLLRLAKLLNLHVVGISFHVGSGCQDPPVFNRAIAHAKTLFDFALDMGYKFYLLDLGGGYPGNKGSSIDEIADAINKALDKYFPSDDVQVIAEPGRFYVASAFTLATSIQSKRSIRADKSLPSVVTHNMYYINDGVYGSFNCVLCEDQRVNPIPLKSGSGEKRSSSIWGPTADSIDQIVEDHLLQDMNPGDWIIFENMGAYSLGLATTFNGFPIPKVHMVCDRNIRLLLKNTPWFTDEHFVDGDNSQNLRTGLDDEKIDSKSGFKKETLAPLTTSSLFFYNCLDSLKGELYSTLELKYVLIVGILVGISYSGILSM